MPTYNYTTKFSRQLADVAVASMLFRSKFCPCDDVSVADRNDGNDGVGGDGATNVHNERTTDNVTSRLSRWQRLSTDADTDSPHCQSDAGPTGG